MVNEGAFGNPLKKPLILQVNEHQTQVEKKLLQYVLDTFVSRNSDLAAFTYQNSSTITLARHYLFHKSSSEETLYQVMRNLNDFCRWTKTQPDEFINRCMKKKWFYKTQRTRENQASNRRFSWLPKIRKKIRSNNSESLRWNH